MTGQGGLPKARPQQFKEKRRHPRRNGPPMPIVLSDDRSSGTPTLCRVVNRSQVGLGIVVDKPLPRGAIIRVRPVEAPEDVAWVRLEIRNCGRRRNEWYLGCRFLGELPWSVILLFG